MKLIGLTVLLLSLFSVAFAQEARKVDEFGNLPCDDFLGRLTGFFVELKDLKEAKGYIFIYENLMLNYRQDKTFYPRWGEAKAEIKNIEQHIAFLGFDRNRIVSVEGGSRERYTVEFWIVLANARPPKPTPTLKKIRYRKGKAEHSCKYI